MAVDVHGDLRRALHIEIPAWIVRFPCIGGGHHITRPIPHVEEFDSARLPAPASRGDELEEPGRTVLVACVGAATGEGVGEDSEIAHVYLLCSHSGILPFRVTVPGKSFAEGEYAPQHDPFH